MDKFITFIVGNKYIPDNIRNKNYIEKLSDISYEINELADYAKLNNTQQSQYNFNSKSDIEIFITGALGLSMHHRKLAWQLKGLFIAHRIYTRHHLRDPHVSRIRFFYSVLYYSWWTFKNIPQRKCYIEKYYIY